MSIWHYITEYEEDGKRYAHAWIQIEIFGRAFTISHRYILVI